MKPADLIAHCSNNVTKAAALAEVSEMAVRNWLKADSIPIIQQRSIEILTKGALKADESL